MKYLMLGLARTVFDIWRSYFSDILQLPMHRMLERRYCSMALKRTADMVFSFLGLILLWPVILISALVIKANSPGPLIYRQERVGKNGSTFIIYKIRTMKEDAEAGNGPLWARRNDPRIIKGGHFLRRYHIDELPQLFNVLKGDMSLVGPRPERPEIVEAFKYIVPNYSKRFSVKPGITGYAQVRHKYDEDIKDVRMKLRYELFYIKKVCLILDILLLLSTFRIIMMRKNEYERGTVYA